MKPSAGLGISLRMARSPIRRHVRTVERERNDVIDMPAILGIFSVILKNDWSTVAINLVLLPREHSARYPKRGASDLRL